jgi:hypothetical protein
MPAVRFTAAGTSSTRGTMRLPAASRRSSTWTGSPSADSTMAKLIFSRE